MLVAVNAVEGMYQGLNGVEDSDVLEVDNISEIKEWGNEASADLVYSYGLEDDYYASLGYEDDDDLDEEVNIEDCDYWSDRSWIAYRVRDDVTMSLDDLREEMGMLGFELFVQEYCEPYLLDLSEL
jgi:hypothetical protein